MRYVLVPANSDTDVIFVDVPKEIVVEQVSKPLIID